MNLSQKSQELLDRYLLAIERKLPIQGRKELLREIEANLMDTLEGDLQTDETIAVSQLEAELRKFGSPKSVARSYRPNQALIGPQHNAIFSMIVTIVVPIVLAVVFFSGLLSFAITGGQSPFWGILELFGVLWQVAIGIIGTATIVFMVLTRFFPDINENINLEFLEDEKSDWSTNDLPELLRKEEKLQIWEPIVGIVMNSIFIVVLLFLFDQIAGFWWLTEDDTWTMVPFFTETFKSFLPWMALRLALEIILYGVQIYQKKISLFSRWFEIALKAFQIGILGMMVNAGTLIQFDAALALSRGFPQEGIDGINMILQNSYFNFFLIFLIVVTTIDLIKKVVTAIKLSSEQL